MKTLAVGPGDESLTRRLGRALAESLPRGAVVGLVGPLGAGKTRLVQAVADAVDVAPGTVTSPTFVLVHEYVGRVPIFHFDVYRIRDEDEFLALGPEEYYSRDGWTFIEWADRVANCLPADRIEIEIEPAGPSERRFTIRAGNTLCQSVVDKVAESFAAKT
jgi:tRNA threonylcarbamoyladenosine biosynthesis protein TsaE